VEDKQIVNVQHAPDPQLLKETHERAQKLGANAGGLGHTEANRTPLEPAAVRRVAKTAIFPLGRVEPQRQVAIGQVDQHSEIVRLDAFRDCLDRIHTERDLDLKFV
jgi:hypothetical protein